MDNLTMVQIILYGVGALGLTLGLLALKYAKPPAQGEAQEK